MAWEEYEDGLYTGDTPMDAFGVALEHASIAWEREHGTLPTFTELATCFRDAASSGRALIDDADAMPELLARWLAGPSGARPGESRARIRRGDVFAVPYARDRAAYGIVLFVESAREPRRGPGIGTLVSIRDRDVADEPVAAALAAPELLRPCHVDEAHLHDRRWPILGSVAVDDAMLPLLHVTLQRGGQAVPAITNYFGDLVDRRDVDASDRHLVRGDHVVRGIRASRGLCRWIVTPGLYAPSRRGGSP